MERFSSQTIVEERQTIVAVKGEIDLAVTDVLWETLDAQLSTGRTLILDCSRVEFLDSMGLRTLIKASQKADEIGATFRLTGSPPAIQRVLDLAGVAAVFATGTVPEI